MGYVWIDDVAVVSRGKLGATHIHSTWAQDDSEVAAGGGWGLGEKAVDGRAVTHRSAVPADHII